MSSRTISNCSSAGELRVRVGEPLLEHGTCRAAWSRDLGRLAGLRGDERRRTGHVHVAARRALAVLRRSPTPCRPCGHFHVVVADIGYPLLPSVSRSPVVARAALHLHPHLGCTGEGLRLAANEDKLLSPSLSSFDFSVSPPTPMVEPPSVRVRKYLAVEERRVLRPGDRLDVPAVVPLIEDELLIGRVPAALAELTSCQHRPPQDEPGVERRPPPRPVPPAPTGPSDPSAIVGADGGTGSGDGPGRGAGSRTGRRGRRESPLAQERLVQFGRGGPLRGPGSGTGAAPR